MLNNIPLFSVQTNDQTQIWGKIIRIESATLNIGKEQKVQFNAVRYIPVKLSKGKESCQIMYIGGKIRL